MGRLVLWLCPGGWTRHQTHPCNNMKNIVTFYPGTPGCRRTKLKPNKDLAWLDQGDEMIGRLFKQRKHWQCSMLYLINIKFSEKAQTIIEILSISTHPDGWISRWWFIILSQKIRRSSQLTAQHSNVNQIFHPSALTVTGGELRGLRLTLLGGYSNMQQYVLLY